MGSWKFRLIVMAVIGLFSVGSYFSNTSVNPVTGEKQRVALSAAEEIALGRQSAPTMVQEFGGLDADTDARRLVESIGQQLIQRTLAADSSYEFAFHLLADPNTVNAFALPGGQIFITRALFDRLASQDQLAGVLGHEIGHVIARHSAERLAKQALTRGLTGAVAVGAGSYEAAQLAQVVGDMINMKYGRGDELDADRFGVCLTHQAGYSPAALVDVMRILAEASGGSRQPEFASTHPDPENRVAEIQAHIESLEQTCAMIRSGS